MTSVSNTNLPATTFDLKGINYQVGQENWQRKGILGKLFGTGEKIVVEVQHGAEHTIDFTIKVYTQNFWQRIGSLFTQDELYSERDPKTYKPIIIIRESECANIGELRHLKFKDKKELKDDRSFYSRMEKARLQIFLDSPQVDLSAKAITSILETGFLTAIEDAAHDMIKVQEAIRQRGGTHASSVTTPRSVDLIATQVLNPNQASESKRGEENRTDIPTTEAKYAEYHSPTQTPMEPLTTPSQSIASTSIPTAAFGPERPSERAGALPAAEVKPQIERLFTSTSTRLPETQADFPVVPFKVSEERDGLFSTRRELSVIIDRMKILAKPHLKLLPLEQRRDAFLDILDGIIRENLGQVLDIKTLKKESDEGNFEQVLTDHLDKAIPKQFAAKDSLLLEYVPEIKQGGSVHLDPEFFYEVAVPDEDSHVALDEDFRVVNEIEEFLKEQEVKSPSKMAMQMAQNLPIANAFSQHVKEHKGNWNAFVQRKISDLPVSENEEFLSTVQNLITKGFSTSNMQEVLDEELRVVKQGLLEDLAKHQMMLQKALQNIPQNLKDAEIFDEVFLSKAEELAADLGLLEEEYRVPVLGGLAGTRVKYVADLNNESIKSYAKTIDGRMEEARSMLRIIKNTLIVSQQFEKAKERVTQKHSQLMLEGRYNQAHALRMEADRSEKKFKKFAGHRFDVSKMAAESHHLTNIIEKLSTSTKPLPLLLQLSEIGDETSPEATALVSAFMRQQENKIQQFLNHLQNEYNRFSLSDHSLLMLNAEAQAKLRKLIQVQMEGIPAVPSEFQGDDLVQQMQAFEDSVEAAMQKATNEIEKLIDLHFYLPDTQILAESKEPRRSSVTEALIVRETSIQRPTKAISSIQKGLSGTLSEFEGMIVQFEKFSRDFPNVESASAADVLHKVTNGRAALGRIMQKIAEENLTDKQIRSDERFIPISEHIESVLAEGRKMVKTQRRYAESRLRFDQAREKIRAKINELSAKPVPQFALSHQLRTLLKTTEKDYVASSKRIQKLTMFFDKRADSLEERLINLEGRQKELSLFQQLDKVPQDSIEAELIKKAFVQKELDELRASEESVASLRQEPLTIEGITFYFTVPEVKAPTRQGQFPLPKSPRDLSTLELVNWRREVGNRVLELNLEAHLISEQRQRLRETLASYKTKLQQVESSIEEWRNCEKYVMADKYAQLLAPLRELIREGKRGSIDEIHALFGEAIRNLDRIQQAMERDPSARQTLLQQLQSPNLTPQLREIIVRTFREEQRAVVGLAQKSKNQAVKNFEKLGKWLNGKKITRLQNDIVDFQERVSLALLTMDEFNNYIASDSTADLVHAKKLADKIWVDVEQTIRAIDLPNMQQLLREYRSQRKRAFKLVDELEPTAAAKLKAQINEIHENFNFMKKRVGFDVFRKALASREGPVQTLAKAIRDAAM